MSEATGSQATPLCNQENDKDRIITELTRANGILKANISTLYRTARAEIARKNDRITELQSSLDNILFKRMNNRAAQNESLLPSKNVRANGGGSGSTTDTSTATCSDENNVN